MDQGKMGIRVTGGDAAISLAPFATVVSSMLSLLRGVDDVIAGSQEGKIEWHIESVSMSSPLCLTIGAPPGYGARADHVMCGLAADVRSLDQAALPPRYLNEPHMEALKKMVSALDGLAMIEIESSDLVVVPTARIVANVNEVIRPYETNATIEGVLQLVNLHNPQEKVFKIYDILTGEGVRGVFADEQWDSVHDHIGKRVIVSGSMTYHRDGRPKEMKLSALEEANAYPTLFFQGPPIDITGGVDPADYIETLREDE